jgi:hypothetical protein
MAASSFCPPISPRRGATPSRATAPEPHARFADVTAFAATLASLDLSADPRAVAALGLAPEQVRLLATGGHYPHMEPAANPEHTARNCDEIVRLVNHMLLSARQGTLLPTELESTITTGDASASSTEPAKSNTP